MSWLTARTARNARTPARHFHQRALLLEEDRPTELRDQFRPTQQRVGSHANDAELGHRRFRQRRQHRGGDVGGRPRRLCGAGFVDIDVVAGGRQLAGQQPAHQAGTQHHRAFRTCSAHCPPRNA